MRVTRVLLIICLTPIAMMSWYFSALAQSENTSQTKVLIPLYARYDTTYKPENSGTACNTSTPILDLLSFRKIIPIVIESPINSRFVCIGDQITARLKEDLYYGTKVLAPQHSLLKGRVISYRAARTLTDATFQKEDRLKSNSAIGIQFTELVLDDGRSIPLIARPVHQETYRKGADGYTLQASRS